MAKKRGQASERAQGEPEGRASRTGELDSEPYEALYDSPHFQIWRING